MEDVFRKKMQRNRREKDIVKEKEERDVEERRREL